MDYKEKTAERLLQLRLENGLTQKELAEKVDTSPQNIDLYESGKRKINVEILGKIADVYNVSTDYLLGRTNTQTLNEDIKAICEFTGLNEKTILMLKDEKDTLEKCCDGLYGFKESTYFQVINDVISSNPFFSMIYNCCELWENSERILNILEFPRFPLVHLYEMANTLEVPMENLLHYFMKQCEKSEKTENNEQEETEYKNLTLKSDLNRYGIIKCIEDISNMFDKRNEYLYFNKEELLAFLKIDNETLNKMQKENADNGKHNTPKE